MICSFKFKTILCVFLLIVVGAFILFSLRGVNVNSVSTKSSIPSAKYSVVIDAGHGGIDGGCEGKTTGVYESELNLIYAKNLYSQLTNMGIGCVLTRVDKNGLYDKDAKNLKKSDMQKRKDIIDKANPTLVISIHMNSFPLTSAHGAQVFYKKGNESGEKFANCVQAQLNKNVENAKKTAKVGDFYMVNCTDLPATLIECGYLSNREEEVLLQKKDYQDKFCYILCCGILDYLNLDK